MKKTKKRRFDYDLEDRLIAFAANVIFFCKSIPKDYAGNHLKGQLIRSGTSPALNYAEANAAESNRDFTHKNKVVLKELKETKVNLKILDKLQYGQNGQRAKLLDESGQLCAIFTIIINNTDPNG
ncbi:MAG: four helix bundle protein [Bacteroidota bacterium]